MRRSKSTHFLSLSSAGQTRLDNVRQTMIRAGWELGASETSDPKQSLLDSRRHTKGNLRKHGAPSCKSQRFAASVGRDRGQVRSVVDRTIRSSNVGFQLGLMFVSSILQGSILMMTTHCSVRGAQIQKSNHVRPCFFR